MRGELRLIKSLGWCIAYDFNNSDYLLCVDILAALLLVPVLWWWALPLLGVDPAQLGGGGGK